MYWSYIDPQARIVEKHYIKLKRADWSEKKQIDVWSQKKMENDARSQEKVEKISDLIMKVKREVRSQKTVKTKNQFLHSWAETNTAIVKPTRTVRCRALVEKLCVTDLNCWTKSNHLSRHQVYQIWGYTCFDTAWRVEYILCRKEEGGRRAFDLVLSQYLPECQWLRHRGR